MQQKVLSPITDSYSAKGENLTTLEIFHSGKNPAIYKGEVVAKYEFLFQIFFPILLFFFLGGLSQHVFENDTKKFFKNVRAYFSNQNNNNPQTEKNVHGIYKITASKKNMYIYMMVIGSLTFVTYVIILDCIGINKRSYFVNADIFYRPNKDSKFGSFSEIFQLEYWIPNVMLIYDLLIWIGAVLTILSFLCCNCCKKRWYHIIMAPFACIIVHSYHILIGFIQSPHHAASILIFYAIIFLVFFVTLKATYYNLFECITTNGEGNRYLPNDEEQEGEEGLEHVKKVYNFLYGKRLPHLVVFFIMSFISVALALIMVYIVYLFIIVPINMAIEDAPAQLFSINQTILVLIGAAITYKLYRNNKSSSNIVEQLVKANKQYLKEIAHLGVNTFEEWDDLEAADKEVEMGKLMISTMHKVYSPPQPQPPSLAPSQMFAQVLTQVWYLAKHEAIKAFLSNNQVLTKALAQTLALVKSCAEDLATEVLSQVIKVSPRAQIQGLAVAPTQAQALSQAQGLAQVQVQAQALIDVLPSPPATDQQDPSQPSTPAQTQAPVPAQQGSTQPQTPAPPQQNSPQTQATATAQQDPPQPQPQPVPSSQALAVALIEVKKAVNDIIALQHPSLNVNSTESAFCQVLIQVKTQAQALADILNPVQGNRASDYSTAILLYYMYSIC